ncbi:MAG: acyl-CoA thioesterase [Gammaproteobacteria bacterium]|nr:acyl-CoA thioesterase [Gammaproteobacteria bacterium]
MLVYYRERTVAWGESDPFGLVYFPRMLAWFNDAEHEFFAQAGYPLTRMVAEDRTAFVMGRVNFEFVGPAGYGEKIVTRLAVKEITRSTVTWDCSARRADKALVTRGTATRVYARIQENGELKAKPIPDSIRALLGGSANDG